MHTTLLSYEPISHTVWASNSLSPSLRWKVAVQRHPDLPPLDAILLLTYRAVNLELASQTRYATVALYSVPRAQVTAPKSQSPAFQPYLKDPDSLHRVDVQNRQSLRTRTPRVARPARESSVCLPYLMRNPTLVCSRSGIGSIGGKPEALLLGARIVWV